jgi:outer membrane protein
MKKVIFFTILIFLTVSQIVLADDLIQEGALLTLERCIEVALKMQPDILAAKSEADMNRRRIGVSKAAYFPQVEASGGYSRTSPFSGTTGSSVGSGVGGGTNAFDTYTGSITLNQEIYAFGKNTAQVKVQRLNWDASISDLETITQQTVNNVKQSYFGVLQARRKRDVAAGSVRQYELHLEQAKGFYEVGTKSKYDVTKAQVDLNTAKLNLIQTENSIKMAVTKLNNFMGVPEAPEYTIEDTLSYAKYGITLEEALAKAYENRPDMKSMAAKRKAAESSVEVVRKGYYPAVTGGAGYSWSGTRSGTSFPLEHRWNIGMAVSVPIFSGFSTKNQVEEAKANLNVLEENEESLRQTVVLELQQSYINLKESEERIPTAELTVQQAKENLDIANGRYETGVGSIIEVTDAEATYATAEMSYIQALYDYKIATANLEKAMGKR